MSMVNDDLMNEILERNARKASTATTAEAPLLSGNCEVRRALLTRCLIESTESVFETMCGWDLERGLATSHDGFASRHDISGIIGFNGPIQATIVVSVEQDFVFAAAESFLGERPTSLNCDVVDLVGELANMIGGNAKERLGIPNVVLGLPTVVAGDGHYIAYNSRMTISMIPFQCQHGSLSIELGLI